MLFAAVSIGSRLASPVPSGGRAASYANVAAFEADLHGATRPHAGLFSGPSRPREVSLVTAILKLKENKFIQLLNEGRAEVYEQEVAYGYTSIKPQELRDEFDITLEEFLDQIRESKKKEKHKY